MFDVCVIGSGAGGSPVAFTLAQAGFNVIVLEKGPWIKTKDFNKDELSVTKKDIFIPNLKDERHEVMRLKSGEWKSENTADTGKDFWNGNVVGGSSNFMSGYFHRMKPSDFKLKSIYGEIEGANIEDWPISYEELEPYYTKVEHLVGVSGKVINHKMQEPRSEADFPYPPLSTNKVSDLIDQAAGKLGISVFNTPRAILSKSKEKRNSCYYSNFCGSYGCSSDAKGSGRAALLEEAHSKFGLTIIPQAKVFHLDTSNSNEIKKVHYYDIENKKRIIEAKIFVVATQATETSRLLLMSKNKKFKNGLGNNNGQVGKNILYSGGGIGSCMLEFGNFDKEIASQLKIPGLFVNRASQEWYEIEDPITGKQIKGGTVDFLWEHSNPVSKVIRNKWDGDRLLFGSELKDKIHHHFTQRRKLNFEVFVDWLPNDNSFVELSETISDKWGDPVGKIWTGNHKHDEYVGDLVGQNTKKILEEMGGTEIKWSASGNPSINLQAGGCRFGDDTKTSVLDKNCKSHEVDNLYVTDGSFMPTGGSVTYTFTIYANAFRIADVIKDRLLQEKS